MKLTSYQEFVIKTLTFQLNDTYIRNNLENKGVKDAIKLMTRHYPEITSEGKKAYQNIERYKKHHRITSRAAKILDQGGTHKDVHPEHLYPNEQIFQDLLMLCKNNSVVSNEDVIQVLQQSEMIIISKEEYKVLDGKEGEEFLLDGAVVLGSGLKKEGTAEKRLKAINASFDTRYENNNLW